MSQVSKPSIAGKVALVTGSSRGIGRAVAQRLASAGATVVVTARSLDTPLVQEGTLRETVSLIEAAGGKAIPIACDIEDRADLGSLVDRAVEAAGRIDILVNNAGYANYVQMADMSDEIFDTTFDNYVRAPFILSRAAIPHMRRQGAGWIIFVGSQTAQHTTKAAYPFVAKLGFVAYGAAKAAVHRMTTGWAGELLPDNIAVNMVSPSTAISTPGASRYTSKDYPTERVEYFTETALQLAYLPAAERTGLITHSMHFPAQKGFTVYTLDGKDEMPPAVIPDGAPPELHWTNE